MLMLMPAALAAPAVSGAVASVPVTCCRSTPRPRQLSCRSCRMPEFLVMAIWQPRVQHSTLTCSTSCRAAQQCCPRPCVSSLLAWPRRRGELLLGAAHRGCACAACLCRPMVVNTLCTRRAATSRLLAAAQHDFQANTGRPVSRACRRHCVPMPPQHSELLGQLGAPAAIRPTAMEGPIGGNGPQDRRCEVCAFRHRA